MKEESSLLSRLKVVISSKQITQLISFLYHLSLVIVSLLLGLPLPVGPRLQKKWYRHTIVFARTLKPLERLLDYHTDYHYKPVWDGTDEGLAEIEAYRQEIGIPKDKTFIMPAGDTSEELIKNVSYCI
jgi:hypothetical protein